MTLEELKEHVAGCLGYEEALVFDNPSFVDAFVGMSSDGRAVYSYDKMIECLIAEDGMDYLEAMEFINYNTIRALPYMGEKAPIVVYDDKPDMWE